MITGRLDQRHRDLLDALFLAKSTWRKTESGEPVLLVDSSKLRSILGKKWNNRSMSEVLQDLQQALVQVTNQSGQIVMSEQIVGSIKVRERGPGIELQATRAAFAQVHSSDGVCDEIGVLAAGLWEIKISKTWLNLLREGGSWSMYPATLLQVDSGTTQAAARFILSQPQGKRYQLRTVLDTIGHPRPWRGWQEIRKNKDVLRKLGVVIDGEYLRRDTDAAQPREAAHDASNNATQPRETNAVG